MILQADMNVRYGLSLWFKLQWWMLKVVGSVCVAHQRPGAASFSGVKALPGLQWSV